MATRATRGYLSTDCMVSVGKNYCKSFRHAGARFQRTASGSAASWSILLILKAHHALGNSMTIKKQAVLVVLLAGVVAGFLGALLASPPTVITFYDNLHWAAGVFAAAFMIWTGIERADESLRPALRWMTLGYGLYAFGQVLWIAQLFIDLASFPAPSDIFYLLLGPFLAVGVWQWSRDRLDTIARRTVLLDTATVLMAVLTACFALYAPKASTYSVLQLAVVIAYPLTLILPAALGLVAMLALRIRPHWSNVTFLVSCAALAIIWADWNLRFMLDQTQAGSWLNISFTIADLLLGYSASRLSLTQLRTVRAARLYNGALHSLPLLMVILTAMGVLLVQTDQTMDTSTHDMTIAGAIITILLAMARQSDVLNEHSRLIDAEQALQEEELRYRTLIESAADGILIWKNGTFSDCNSATLKLFGCQRDYIIGRTPWEVSPRLQPDGELSISKALRRVTAALRGESQKFEWQHQQQDGTLFDTEVTLNLLEGDTTRFIAIVRDITERKKTESEIREKKELLQATLNAIPGIFAVFDESGRIVTWNEQFQLMLEYRAEDIPTLELLQLCVTEDADLATSTFTRMLCSADIENLEIRLISRTGRIIPVLASASRAMLNGTPHVVGFAQDISIRKLMEKELHEFQLELVNRNNSLRLLNLLSSRLDTVSELDEIGNETVHILQMLGKSSLVLFYLIGEDQDNLELIAYGGALNENELENYRHARLQHSVTRIAIQTGNIMRLDQFSGDLDEFSRLKDFLQQHSLTTGTFIPLQISGRVIGVINLFFEQQNTLAQLQNDTLEAISKTVSLAIKNAYHLQDLEHQAQHDSLTHLPNRQVLHDAFVRALMQEPPPRRMALMLLDLNRFKEVNDTLGHHAGDVLLQQTSQRLAHLAESHDALVCRLGGDEFAVLIQRVEDDAMVMDFAGRIAAVLRKPSMINGKNLQVGASIGVALYPEHGNDSHALLRAADVAMYSAKRRVTDVALYDREFDNYSPERLSIMSDLGDAINTHQLVLHYQPKLALDNKTVTGFEALVRWQHPQLGFLFPDSFIPVAEQGETIHRLTRTVLEMALSQQRQWKKQGYQFTVAVNLSARNLMDDRAIDIIRDLLQKYGTRPGELELEITETALMQDPDFAAQLLHRIAALGVVLSIDDFGTGYSSLGYLRHLPISSLKIDRLFVKEMLKNEQDAIIVRSTIGLAHNLSMQVIAEGVEDASTCLALEEMGCDVAQGYYLSQPRPWPDIQRWLQDTYLDAQSNSRQFH